LDKMTHRGPFQPLPFCDSVIKCHTKDLDQIPCQSLQRKPKRSSVSPQHSLQMKTSTSALHSQFRTVSSYWGHAVDATSKFSFGSQNLSRTSRVR